MIINSTVTDGEIAAYTVRISWTKGWLISQAGWRRMEWDGVRFHHATQNGMQFKIYELFISGNFHLIFSDHSWPRVNGVTDGRGGGGYGNLNKLLSVLYWRESLLHRCRRENKHPDHHSFAKHCILGLYRTLDPQSFTCTVLQHTAPIWKSFQGKRSNMGSLRQFSQWRFTSAGNIKESIHCSNQYRGSSKD